MEKFRSKLNFWKKVEKKAPTSASSPKLSKAGGQDASVAPPSAQLQARAPPSSGSSPQLQQQEERRSEQLGQNYPAKPLPRPGANASAAPQQYGAGVRASMPAQVASQVASAAPPAGTRGSVPNARQLPSAPIPNASRAQGGAGRGAALGRSGGGAVGGGGGGAAGGASGAGGAGGAGGGAGGSVGVGVGVGGVGGGEMGAVAAMASPPESQVPMPMQQKVGGAPAVQGARTRTSMPSVPSERNTQQNTQGSQGSRMSVQPGTLPQASSRGQLPQPPGQGKIPPVRGSMPPSRAPQQQRQQQRGIARGPLPVPPAGVPPVVVARGPLPTPPTGGAGGAGGAGTGSGARPSVVPPDQGSRPQLPPQQRGPVNVQRQSVQARPNPAQRLNAQQVQRQSMPHMNKQRSQGSQTSLSSSRPPDRPQPAIPNANSSSNSSQRAQPAPPDKAQAQVEAKQSSEAEKNGSRGIKPLVIAEIFQQSSSPSLQHNEARKSKRERRGDAGDEEALLKDLTGIAKAQPVVSASQKANIQRQHSQGERGERGERRERGEATEEETLVSQSSESSASDEFFVPIASMKQGQCSGSDDGPPTPPPRSPDGDRSHRSQRTAAPKIPGREPAAGEKRQTGFMSRIKSVFGSAPVVPQEEVNNATTSAAVGSAVAVSAATGAVAAEAVVSKSSSQSAQAKLEHLGRLPPTATSFDKQSGTSATLPSDSSANSDSQAKKAKKKKHSKGKGKSASQKANKLSNSQKGGSTKGNGSSAAVGAAYGLTDHQLKSMKPEKKEQLLRSQLQEIDDKIEANSRTKEGLQKMAELSSFNDPMFEAQLMDLNTMLAQLMEGRSRIAAQLENIGSIAPKTPILSPRGAENSSSGRSSSARRGTLARAGSSAANLRARFFRSLGSTAAHPQQLDTMEGDVVAMVWRAPTGWWKVARNGQEGYVHSTYLEALSDEEGERTYSIQTVSQPQPDSVSLSALPVSLSLDGVEDIKPIPLQPTLANSQPVSISVVNPRQSVIPEAVVKAQGLESEPSTQRRMTMPLPKQPSASNGTKVATSSENRSMQQTSAQPAGAAAAAAAGGGGRGATPVQQRPSYPQAKVMFAFAKSTATEIGIEAGLQVSIIEVAGEWSYILHEPTANAGYIPNSYLEKL